MIHVGPARGVSRGFFARYCIAAMRDVRHRSWLPADAARDLRARSAFQRLLKAARALAPLVLVRARRAWRSRSSQLPLQHLAVRPRSCRETRAVAGRCRSAIVKVQQMRISESVKPSRLPRSAGLRRVRSRSRIARRSTLDPSRVGREDLVLVKANGARRDVEFAREFGDRVLRLLSHRDARSASRTINVRLRYRQPRQNATA